MSEFTRTPSGLVAKYLFFRVPLVWVEGRFDIPFYSEVLRGVACRVEAAGGRHECQALAQALLGEDLPYVVVVDGDYDILNRSRNPGSRFIRLRRYSIENYLCERGAVEAVCRGFIEQDSAELVADKFEKLVEIVHGGLFDLVALDAAHVLGGTGERALPEAADALFETRTGLRLSEARIAALEKKAAQGIENRRVATVKRRVENFCSHHRLIDVLRGKVAFGLLRRFVLSIIEGDGRRVPQIDNESLRLLLIGESWRNLQRSSDHFALKRRLRTAVRSAAKQLANSREGRASD